MISLLWMVGQYLKILNVKTWLVPRAGSLRKQPTFGDATTGLPSKWVMVGGASNWLCHMGNLIQPIRSTTQIWVVTRHQYGISVLISQTSFGGETSGSVTKCHFTGKPVVASRNVGCFLRLMSRQRARMNRTMYSDLLSKQARWACLEKR